MGLWHRLRDLDDVIIAGGRDLQMDDAQVQAWWDALSPEQRVAVWGAARSQHPHDPAEVHAWVAILKARSQCQRRWSPWYGLVGLLVLTGLVLGTLDAGLQFAGPVVGAVVGVALGRLRVQATLERRRADLLAWLLSTRSAAEIP